MFSTFDLRLLLYVIRLAGWLKHCNLSLSHAKRRKLVWKRHAFSDDFERVSSCQAGRHRDCEIFGELTMDTLQHFSRSVVVGVERCRATFATGKYADVTCF